MNLGSKRSTVNKRLAALAVVRAKIVDENRAMEQVEAKQQALEEATAIAQAVAQQVQNQAHAQIATIVSRCLEAVFDEPYVFHIHFERKRNRTEARLVFERGGQEVDPLVASGGGVVDVAAFALRVACLLLSRPALRRVLILDEPFRFVSPDLRPRVKTLLESLAEEMKIQIVMVTHDSQLRAGKIVQLS